MNRLLAVLCLAIASSGCTSVAITLAGLGASVGANHMISNVSHRTFTMPMPEVAAGVLSALTRMEFEVDSVAESPSSAELESPLSARFESPIPARFESPIPARFESPIPARGDSPPSARLIRGTTRGREVEIALEPLSPNVTRMRSVVRYQQSVALDGATAREIIAQTERALEGTSAGRSGSLTSRVTLAQVNAAPTRAGGLHEGESGTAERDDATAVSPRRGDPSASTFPLP